MLMPNKYITLAESCIGISGLILECLGKNKMTVDELWVEFSKLNKHGDNIKFPSYQKFVYSINFMYLANMIEYTNQGEIFNENIRT